MKEIWNDIERLGGTHQISNMGRIKGVDRWIDCRGLRLYKGKVLRLQKGRDGYLFTNLKSRGKAYNIKPHREVANCFIPKIEGKEYVNHIDGNKENNSVENLEWCTMAENNQHAYDIGLKLGPIGTKQWNSKLTEDKVIEIYKMARTGKYSDPEIARNFGIKRLQVLKIRRGLTWSWLTKNIAL